MRLGKHSLCGSLPQPCLPSRLSIGLVARALPNMKLAQMKRRINVQKSCLSYLIHHVSQTAWSKNSAVVFTSSWLKATSTHINTIPGCSSSFTRRQLSSCLPSPLQEEKKMFEFLHSPIPAQSSTCTFIFFSSSSFSIPESIAQCCDFRVCLVSNEQVEFIRPQGNG